MPNYIVNTKPQDKGEHEVHTITCQHLPIPEHRKDLGFYSHCIYAMNKARETYSNVDGCKFCCPDCHTK